MASITAAERHEIAEIIVLMFNAAPGATYLAQLVSGYQSVGNNLDTLTDYLAIHPAYTAVHTSVDTNEEWTDDLLDTVGLKGDLEASTRINNALVDGVSKGDITFAVYQFLNTVHDNPGAGYGPQYVRAAEILEHKADVAIYYSVDKGIASTNLAELQAAIAGVDETDESVAAAEDAIDHQFDPQAFNLTIDAPSVTEDDDGTKIMTFTLTLLDTEGGATVGSTTVNFATANGTATSGDDYQAAAGQVTFAPGQTQATVSITVLGDTTFEPNETVLLNVTGAALVSAAQGTGTIVNNDPPPQTFTAAINSPSVTEGDAGTTFMSFVITLDQAPTKAVSFTYATVNGSGEGVATAGNDYIATSGTVSFAIGQTSATVSVVINGDTTPELAETLALTLTGAQLSAPTTGTGTILNDDTDFFLTTELDDLTTSPFDDTINGTELTFTLGDEINGSDGDDLLKLVFDGPDGVPSPAVILAPFTVVSNVERVEITSDLSVGEDGSSNTFDMSDWTGVNEIMIRTAGNADVNVESNASESVDIFTISGAVTLVDNTVDDVKVDAGDDVTITALGASNIEAEGEDVMVTANDANVDAFGTGSVTVNADDGDFLVSAGGDANVNVGDSVSLEVSANGNATVDADIVDTAVLWAGNTMNFNALSVSDATVTGNGYTQVTATDLIGWATGNGLGFDDDAQIWIGGEDGDVLISAGSATDITVANGEDLQIDVGNVGSVSLFNVQPNGDDDVHINQFSDDSLDLLVSDTDIGELHISEATTVVNLTSTGNVSDDSGSYLNFSDDSTVETINLDGDHDLTLDTTAVGGVLTAIHGAGFTGDLTLYASDEMDVTSGTGDDTILVYGSEDAAVTVDAGEGDNVVDVNSNGVVEVTVGDGDDDVTVNFDSLTNEGSGVNLGEGTNTLRLRSFDPITDEDLDAFDDAALPLTGTLNALIFAAEVDLGEDSASTIDVGDLDGPVTFIGFGDVDVEGDQASLTIAGTGPELVLASSDDFGSDGSVLVLETNEVTDLMVSADDDVSIQMMGDDLENLTINAGEDIDLVLNGDSNSDDAVNQDQLESLASVTLHGGEDISVDIQNIQNAVGFALNIDAGDGYFGEDGGDGNVWLHISDANVGDVMIDFGSEDSVTDVLINGTFESDATVGDITINDGAGFSDDNDGSSINIEVSDNVDSFVTIGTVMASADGDVMMSVRENDHSRVEFDGITLESRHEEASLLVFRNIDNEAGADAIVILGDVSVTSGDDTASLTLDENSDSAITVGEVNVMSMFSDAFVVITDNSEATVDMGDVTISAGGNSGYGAPAFLLISDNDVADVEVGNVTIDSVGSAWMAIALQDNGDVGVGNVEITSTGYDASFSVYGNCDSSDIETGTVDITADRNAYFSISDNIDSSVAIGEVTITTDDGVALTSTAGNVYVDISEGANSDSVIIIEGFDIDAEGDVFFTISNVGNGVDPSDGIFIDGDVTIVADEMVVFDMEDVDSVGDISVTAGGSIDFSLIDVGTGGELVTLAAFSDVDAFVSNVDLESLTVSAGGDAAVTIVDVDDAKFTLDISGVIGGTLHNFSDANIDATQADFDSSGVGFNTVFIGNSNVMYMNDLVMSGDGFSDTDGVTDESRELFVFGDAATDDVGVVVIDNFRPGAFAANLGPDGDLADLVWSDRLNFSRLGGVDSLEDMTFNVVGADVVIDFVNPAYGSITLTGVAADYVNATDLVQASITFTAVA